jgi:hypothetical protein
LSHRLNRTNRFNKFAPIQNRTSRRVSLQFLISHEQRKTSSVGIVQLPDQSFLDSPRIAVNHDKVSANGIVRLGAALLPFLQRSQAKSIACGEIGLRHAAFLAYGANVNAIRDMDGSGRSRAFPRRCAKPSSSPPMI